MSETPSEPDLLKLHRALERAAVLNVQPMLDAMERLNTVRVQPMLDAMERLNTVRVQPMLHAMERLNTVRVQPMLDAMERLNTVRVQPMLDAMERLNTVRVQPMLDAMERLSTFQTKPILDALELQSSALPKLMVESFQQAGPTSLSDVWTEREAGKYRGATERVVEQVEQRLPQVSREVLRRLVLAWAAAMLMACLSTVAMEHPAEAKELGAILALPLTLTITTITVLAALWKPPSS